MLEFTKMRKKGFLLIYDSISPKNNEKKYIAEGIYFLNNSVCIIKTMHSIAFDIPTQNFWSQLLLFNMNNLTIQSH